MVRGLLHIDRKKKAMKRLLILLLAAAAAGPLAAQGIGAADSAVFDRLLAQNRHYRTAQGTVLLDMTKRGRTRHKEGTFYFERVAAPKAGDIVARMAMRYHTPKGEYYVITPTNLYNGLDGRRRNIGFRYVAPMKLLGSTIAWAAVGDIYSLCDRLKPRCRLTEDRRHYTVTLTCPPKNNRGINRMVIKYRKSDGLIAYLEVEDRLGTLHQYTLGSDTAPTLLNKPVDPAVFVVD